MACAVCAPVGTSTHALEAGHVRWLQSGALYSATSEADPHPLKQLHFEFTVSHTPLPLQLLRLRHEPPRAAGSSALSSARSAARRRSSGAAEGMTG
jgi:hypothetical protein